MPNVRWRFNVNAAAQAAGVAALRDEAHVTRSCRHNARGLAWFSDELRGLGLSVPPSVGNFVLVGFAKQAGRDAAAGALRLKKHGILVRGMAAYGLDDCLRMTIGTDADMRAVAEALSGFMA